MVRGTNKRNEQNDAEHFSFRSDNSSAVSGGADDKDRGHDLHEVPAAEHLPAEGGRQQEGKADTGRGGGTR